MSGRATLPGLRAALLRGGMHRSAPASGRPASAGSGTAVADTSSSDGGAAAGFDAANRFGASLASPALATPDMKASLALLDSATTAAQEELAAANFHQAADFAELAENLSRRIEYFQLLAAAAVDRTRTEAINAAETARGRLDHRLRHRTSTRTSTRHHTRHSLRTIHGPHGRRRE